MGTTCFLGSFYNQVIVQFNKDNKVAALPGGRHMGIMPNTHLLIDGQLSLETTMGI